MGSFSVTGAHNSLSQTADTILTVSLSALKDNYRTVAKHAGTAECAAVVKADAYGIGLTEAARAFAEAGAETFFVAQLSEAVELRAILNDWPQPFDIYVFAGLQLGQEETFVAHEIRPVLNTPAQLDLWSAQGHLPAALHIDTGMNRLGMSAAEVSELSKQPDRIAGIDLKLVMSHLACADTPDHPLNRKQLDRFNGLRDQLPKAPASLSNSAGIFLGPDYHFDMVRPGIALYGGNPQPAKPRPVKPVVRIDATILQIREVPAGETVGYGATFKTSRPTRLAILSLGYADGMMRALSNTGWLDIGGIRAPIAGRISMDLIAVDVTDIPLDRCAAGSRITVVGDNPDVNDLAAAAETISYEFLTLLGQRYERHYEA